ncbi:hypothetical protein COT98_02580 [Candidatus Falkowbacteria bacterium CG10_big_fil_rev_8_21_14_0_10_39_9]|uniref:PAS domain-containing protein n=1 Tax=Candidatus Falkowbacteria bacterium CG10_big_fil_rev_8_21_14_0_10_39_9 TaxID=1974566 RepID=A0A2M6WPE8_9BACT|nr:MAG: hypothetical protein COT98_02580 [Candidatus Falkowbacteria bacterium CG10_big_fil_rev_8_21_14_0_10_39_9]
MSFRKKIIIFVVLVSFGLLILLYSSLLFVLDKNFNYLENDFVNLRLKRVESASQIYFDALKSKASDWAEWDDSYDFVIDHNEDFVVNNFNDSSLVNLDVSAVIYADNSGNIIGSHAYNFIAEKTDPDFVSLFKSKLADPYFKNYFMSTDYQRGIVLLSGNRPPLYLVSKKILRSDGSGPSLGYIFMGRFLEQEFVNYRFGDLALYSISLKRVDDSALPNDFLAARNRLIMSEKTVIVPNGSNSIYGYSLYNDYSDSPAFVFRIETERTLYRYEINILIYISALLLAVILLFVLFFLWMISRVFIDRLVMMFNKVEEYKKNPSSNVSISITGKDELSKLSEEFNELVHEVFDSGNFYKNLLVGLPDIVALVKAGRVIYINDAIEANTGFKKEEVLGKLMIDFVDKDYKELVMQNLKLRFSGVDVLPYNIKMITKNNPLDIRVSAKVIDYRGEKVDLIVLTNISEAFKSQKKLAEKVAELENLNRIMINRELKMMDLKKKMEAAGSLDQK